MDALRSQGLKSVIYGTLVIAIGIVFVVQFKPGGQGQGVKVDCAAEVRGECVSSRDFRAAFSLAVPRLEDAAVKQLQLRKHVLNGLVERSLLAQDAERLGLAVSDDDLNAALTSGQALVSLSVETPPMITQMYLRLPVERPMRLLDVKGPGGQFDKKAYEKALRFSVGRGQAEFREMQRVEHLAARMRDLVRSRVRISEAELFAAYEREKTKVSFRYVKLDRGWITRFLLPKDKAALDAFSEQHKDQINAAWESRKSQYLPECRRARHVLAKAGHTATDDERAAARKKIESAIERAKKGEPFDQIARELSEDNSAEEGGALGCVVKGKMVKPFEDAVFSMKAGDVSAVVETEYGFHTILLEGIYKDADAEAQGRSDVAHDLMLSIESESRAAELGKKLLEAAGAGKGLDEALRDALPALPKSAKNPLEDPDAPKVQVSADTGVGGVNPLPGSEAIAIAFSLQKPNEVPGDLLKLDSGYAVLQLIERKAPTREGFEADRDRLSREMLAQKQFDALTAYVNRLRDVAKAEIKINQAYLADKTPEEPSE